MDPMPVVADEERSAEVSEVVAWTGEQLEVRNDWLACEEPLEIRLAGISLAVTMRTPGDDFDLVRGFLVTEGIVSSLAEVASLAHCADESGNNAGNIVNVNLTDPSSVDARVWQRNFYATSSCGICGKASIEAVMIESPSIESDVTVPVNVIYGLQVTLDSNQPVFRATGGLHAAALFDLTGKLQAVREDVGRHNAVDKVIGWAATQGGDLLTQSMLLVSGRASFEVIQKALQARIPVVAAVSAPSSLAVSLARESHMTLIGFLRPGRCNVYAGAQRITGEYIPH